MRPFLMPEMEYYIYFWMDMNCFVLVTSEADASGVTRAVAENKFCINLPRQQDSAASMTTPANASRTSSWKRARISW